MSIEKNRGNSLENDPAIEKRIQTFVRKMAKVFFTDPEIIEDIVREYIRMRPLPGVREMKDWEANFLQEKRDLIRREVIVAEVSTGCGVAAQAVVEIILSGFLDEYPFPALSDSQEEWRDFLTLACFENIEELQIRTEELIEEDQLSEE